MSQAQEEKARCSEAYSSGQGQYFQHYTKTNYFPLWQKTASLLKHSNHIYEIGCGVGQFAHYLNDKGFSRYTGIDVVPEAITEAKKRVPHMNFIEADAFDFQCEYDTVVILEVLEHIENDLELLKTLKPCKIVLSVPNFICDGHVRCFNRIEDVLRRYHIVESVSTYFFSGRWYLVEGNIK